jgi:hypothetical protein
LREEDEEEIPKEHGLIVSTITAQTLGVFSQCTGTLTEDIPHAKTKTDTFSIPHLILFYFI